jgi:hypothetical protein
MQDVGHPVGAHHPSRTSALRPDKSSGSAQHGDLITEHRETADRGRGVEFGTARVVYDVGGALLLPKLSSLAGLAGGELK